MDLRDTRNVLVRRPGSLPSRAEALPSGCACSGLAASHPTRVCWRLSCVGGAPSPRRASSIGTNRTVSNKKLREEGRDEELTRENQCLCTACFKEGKDILPFLFDFTP